LPLHRLTFVIETKKSRDVEEQLAPMSNGCRDVVRFEPPNFWRGTPARQHKPVYRFDLTGVALIDTAGKYLRLRRENCTYLLGAGTLSIRRPSPTPPGPRVTFASI
jgi:hypothetical protein